MEFTLIIKAAHEGNLMLEKLNSDLVDKNSVSGTLKFPTVAVHPMIDSYDIDALIEQARQLTL